MWEPLLRQKFREDLESLAAAWIWSRIHRLASSRRGLFQEWLGFLDGGTDVLVEKLVRAVRQKRGTLHCGTPVERLFFVGDRVEGLRFDGRDHLADAVVSTVPLPLLVDIAPDFPESYRDAACDLNTIGVRCLVLKLKRPLSPHFWINVNDDGLFVCGLIEYTNLSAADRFGGHSVLYSPLYAPRSHPEYRRPDEEVYEKTVDAISLVEPRFDRSDVVDYRVFREAFAQPICPVGFTRRLAPIRTPISNLVAADTSYLLPHDRSISDSLALAERMMEVFREIVNELCGRR